MQTLIDFVQRYEILLLALLIAVFNVVLLILCFRHLYHNSSFTSEQKKKWMWHLIHWNIFAIPVYWKKHMRAPKR